MTDKQALKQVVKEAIPAFYRWERMTTLEKLNYQSDDPVSLREHQRVMDLFFEHFTPVSASALLSELEAAQHTAAVDHEAACSLAEENEELKRRIATLESARTMSAAENIFMHDVLVRLAKARPGGCHFNKWEPLITKAISHPATDAILAEVRAQGMASLSSAIQSVISERQRQQSVEGWTPEHDDEYTDGQLAIAASCYALMGAREQFLSDGEYQQSQKMLPYLWPWDPTWWKPKGARPDLVRAGALILAELERIDRQEAAQ